MSPDKIHDLEYLRTEVLPELEDAIIFSIFKRSNYKANKPIYTKGSIAIPSFNGTYLDFLLKNTEMELTQAGKYENPNKLPFTAELASEIIKGVKIDSPIIQNDINMNPRIKSMYIESIPIFCEGGDDNKHYASAMWDIRILKAISERVHTGFFVAESKFTDDSGEYSNLAMAGDKNAIIQKLTNNDVEEMIGNRVKEKGEFHKVDPDFVAGLYANHIIPLTKELQVKYLLLRGKEVASGMM